MIYQARKHLTSVHINQIKPGDTVFHHNEEKTVCDNDITYDSFMGKAIFGDCYHLGYKPVLRIDFENPLDEPALSGT